MATCQPPTAVPKLSSSSGRSATEARALKVHSDAERRRRERINAHLATLRRMIPDASQMDKATLLASVVNQVRALKRKATETTTQATTPIPPEANEITVQCYAECSHAAAAAGDSRTTYIRATVSCDDRPSLLADLAGAFHGLRLRALRTEVASLGGRVHHVFVLCKEDSDISAGMKSLEQAVRQALTEVAFLPEMVCGGSSRSKVQKLLEAQCSVMYSMPVHGPVSKEKYVCDPDGGFQY